MACLVRTSAYAIESPSPRLLISSFFVIRSVRSNPAGTSVSPPANHCIWAERIQDPSPFDKKGNWIQPANPDELFLTLSKNCELIYIEEPSQALKEANLKAFPDWFGGIGRIRRYFKRSFICLCPEVVFVLPCCGNHVGCGCLSLLLRHLSWSCPMCRRVLFGNKDRKFVYTPSGKVFVNDLSVSLAKMIAKGDDSTVFTLVEAGAAYYDYAWQMSETKPRRLHFQMLLNYFKFISSDPVRCRFYWNFTRWLVEATPAMSIIFKLRRNFQFGLFFRLFPQNNTSEIVKQKHFLSNWKKFYRQRTQFL